MSAPSPNSPQVPGTELQNAELFGQILNNIGQVCWIADLQTETLLYAGPAFHEIWGSGSASRYPDPNRALEIIHPEDRPHFLSFLEKDILESVEGFYRVVCPDGSLRSLHCRRFPIRNSEGAVCRALEMVRDVTRQRKLEERLCHTHEMEALERMAGGLVHRFNNLLTIVSGYSHILLNQTQAEGAAREDLRRILNASNQAARITGQLLAFSGRQFNQPRRIRINQLLAAMADPLFEVLGGNITVATTFRPDAGYITVDPDQLQRVVIELAANARDAMPNGGLFRIETELVEVSAEQIERWAATGPCVQLRVSDNGCGMDRRIRQRIFEPFFTTKGVNSGGVGLSMVYGIVRQNGGVIDLQSEPGNGTVFRLWFPPAAESEAASQVFDRCLDRNPAAE